MHGNNEFDNPTGLAFDIDNHCMWCVDICSLSLSTEIQNKSIVNFYSSFVKWKWETVNNIYCILRGRIKGFNSSITAIMCQVGSYRTVVGSYRMVE